MTSPLSTGTLPALSALVVIPDQYNTVARTVEALRKQSCVDSLELVFVVPGPARGTIPLDLLCAFHSVQVVDMQNRSYAGAMAQGVRAARAPIVAFTEDHAFPAPNWAECLIAAHQNGYAVVGPAMVCGNPDSPASLADFYIGYGKWALPIESRVVDFLMAHNSSYKREALLRFGARLEEKLESETVLQYDLARQGCTFWLEAGTQTTHTNFERWDSWLGALVFNGRVFGAQRAAGWGTGKRLAYALAFPLIPVVRFLRIRRDVGRARYPIGSRPGLYFVIGAGLLLDAVGQGLGYAFGKGDTQRQGFEYEFHRERHLTAPHASSAK